MSKFVKVQTQLRDLNLIKRALEDLALDYREETQYIHRWSGHREDVPILVQTDSLTFGLRAGDEGAYEVVGDDMHMRHINASLARIQQRYAYHSVVAATSEAGFDLVEEQVGSDQVIRMTVRRWS